MRIVLATLVLACAGRAGDPLVTPVGTSLEAVSVHVDLSGVRTDSAKAAAESYARYIVEQRAAVLRFGALFREAHVAVLRRYYAGLRHYITGRVELSDSFRYHGEGVIRF